MPRHASCTASWSTSTQRWPRRPLDCGSPLTALKPVVVEGSSRVSQASSLNAQSRSPAAGPRRWPSSWPST
eukprot:2489338-Alexandrium_andersonii.AAC.1